VPTLQSIKRLQLTSPSLRVLASSSPQRHRRKCSRGASATAAVKDLLPSYAGNDLSRLCSWADVVKFRYHWSSPPHYIDTPDGLCGYSYDSKQAPLATCENKLNQRCHDLASSPSRQGRLQGRGRHHGQVRRGRHQQLHLAAPLVRKIRASPVYVMHLSRGLQRNLVIEI
jgi:hypothetical protein